MTTSTTTEIDGQIIRISGNDEQTHQLIAELKQQNARNIERERVFPGSGPTKMTALCRLFPTLTDAGGIDPWDSERFVLWALNSSAGSGKVHAIRFVLQVWNSHSGWPELLKQEVIKPEPEEPRDRVLWAGLQRLKMRASKHLAEEARESDSPRAVTEAQVLERLSSWFATLAPFNCCDAFGVWDEPHRDAFRAWAAHPFFP